MPADLNFGNYAPDQYIVTFGGSDIQGFADGTFIKAARTEPNFKLKVGARGSVTRVRTNNLTGTVTITLQAISPSNADLQALANLDQLSGAGVTTLQIKDLNGTVAITADKAWINKIPDAERSDDGANVEWEIGCAALDIQHAGSLT